MCCEPKNDLSQKEREAIHVGQCPECGADVDKDGDCIEPDDCNYSPSICDMCDYSPCDDSC